MSDRIDTPVDDAGLPVSARIRARIQAARQRFHANDNIADFLEPGELDELLAEVEGKVKGVLESLVIDTESDHNTQDTARRVAKMYLTEVFRGRYARRPATTEFPNVEHYEIVVRKKGPMDEISLRFESVPPLEGSALAELTNRLAERLKIKTNLRFRLVYEPPGTLKRYTMKAKRFIDLREEGR
jgi:hypothetical protein